MSTTAATATTDNPTTPGHTDPFTLLFLGPLQRLLEDEGKDLTRIELRVLLYLICSADYGNTLYLYVSEAAEKLEHDRSSISKALATLTALALIHVQRDPRGGRSRYTLSPDLSFRGTAPKRATLRRIWHGRRN